MLPQVQRSAKEVRLERAREVDSVVTGWMDKALQLGDEALREQALDEIHRALGSSNPTEAFAALTAFGRLSELAFDKASFRPEILAWLDSDDEVIRNAACFALLASGLQDGDEEILRQQVRRGVGPNGAYLLMRVEKGDLTGESGGIVAELLRGAGEDTKEVLNGLWGGKFSLELEAEVIALSRDPRHRYDATYFALSTQQNKSPETVDRLIELLGDRDSFNVGGRVAWGLGFGVREDQRSKVADAAVEIVTTRISGHLQKHGWNLLEKYAGVDQLAGLEALEMMPNLPDERRQIVSGLLARIGRP